MFTALRATSLTIADHLRTRLESDPTLAPFFSPAAGGTMVVSLNTPQEMSETNAEGLSVWLYRVIRDAERLNAPPELVAPNQIRATPLPLRLHYLITPITGNNAGPETEHTVLGKVLQALYDRPILRGADLKDDLTGTNAQIHLRLELLSLEEIARIWEALDRSYQLSVSYEASIVEIESSREPEAASLVQIPMPEYSVIVSAEPE